MLGIGLRFTLVALAFSGMIRVFGLLGKFLPTIKNLIWLLKALRLAFLSSPLGMILALGTALALLYDDYKTWREGGKSLIDWSKWAEDIDKGLAILGSIYDWVSSLVSKVINEFGRLDPAIQAIIGSISGLAIIGVLIAKHGFGIKYFTMARKSALGLAKVLRALFKVFALTPIGRAIALIGLLTTAIGWLIKDFNKWKSGADSFLPWAKWSKSIDRIMDKIRSFLDLLGDVKDKVVNFVQKIISDPVEAVNEVVDTAKDTLKTKDSGEPSQPVKTINEVSKNIVDGANNIVDKVLDVGATTVTALADSVRSITQKGVEAVMGVGKSVDQTVRESLKVNNNSFSHFIGKGEGGYNSVNLGKKYGYKASTRPLTSMTVKEVYEMQKRKEVNAVGKFQIIRSTMPEVIKGMKLSGKEKFDEEMQEKMGAWLLFNKRKALGDYLKGKHDNLNLAGDEGAREWASLPVLSDRLTTKVGDRTYHSKRGSTAYSDGVNKAQHSSSKYEKALLEARKIYQDSIKAGLTSEQAQSAAFKGVVIKTVNSGSNLSSVPKIANVMPPTGNPNREQINQTNTNTKSSQVTIHQEFKTDMTINGAKDPVESANAVKRQQENSMVIMARNAKGLIA